ncbi:MAG: HNH endonuclease [Nitriliruptorales bacterium]
MRYKTSARCGACGKRLSRRDEQTPGRPCSRCGYSDPSHSEHLYWNWDNVRVAVLNRDGWVCRLRFPGCEGYARQVDHLIPPTRGGVDHPDNLRAACSSCHAARARTW